MPPVALKTRSEGFWKKHSAAVANLVRTQNKPSPFSFRSQCQHDNKQRDIDRFESRQRPGITKFTPKRVFDRIDWRGNQNSELICQPRQEPAGLIGGELV